MSNHNEFHQRKNSKHVRYLWQTTNIQQKGWANKRGEYTNNNKKNERL